MAIYVPPAPVIDTYTQGFWYAVLAAVLYCICSMLLMINMLGFFLGHYPQHFTLTDHQRTLILQTMLFFIWLAGGAAIFSRVEDQYGGPGNGLSYTDAVSKSALILGMRTNSCKLYFCDVTILTVGFGDIYPHDDVGRGLVFPFSVGGIIMLGLVVSSINKFAGEISENKIVKTHINNARTRTLERTVTSEHELVQNQRPPRKEPKGRGLSLFPKSNTATSEARERKRSNPSENGRTSAERRTSRQGSVGEFIAPVRKRLTIKEAVRRKPKLILLREEKDRFEAMRKIQRSTDKFKRWWRLTLSVIAFGVLWCIGAVVFWQCEKNVQGMTYFQGLYFCYVSLLTIGYGDLAPKSNAGRPFFVVWSLIAVPTMTLLISDMGDTVISSFKNGTFAIADFTLLPKEGVWHKLIQRSPRLKSYLEQIQARRRIKRGMPGPADEIDGPGRQPSLQDLAAEAEQDEKAPPPSSAQLARDLALAIKRTAHDLTLEVPKKYSYEEWVEITRLIRFTSGSPERAEQEAEAEGLIAWDWIGEDSPMMSGQSEAEFVLDRLSESLTRYMRHVERKARLTNVAGPPEGVDVQDTENASCGDRTIKFADDDQIGRANEGEGSDKTATEEKDQNFRDTHWLGRRRSNASSSSEECPSPDMDGARSMKEKDG